MSQEHNRRLGTRNGIDHLKRLAYFAEVVEAGSFTIAAERLGITKAVVSQQVAKLERAFETTLLVRTTRSVRTTDEGRALYERCVVMLAAAQEAFDALETDDRTPAGTLRLTAPIDYGVGVVVPAIAEFLRRHPACAVDVVMSDELLDQGGNDIEVAIRLGWLADSDLRARRIGTFGQILVARPETASGIDATSDPEDVAGLPFVANANLPEPTTWHFGKAGAERRTVRFGTSLSIRSTLGVLEAVRCGTGASVLPDFAVVDDLASGRLVRVLPEWHLDDVGVYAVMPPARFRPARVTAFLALLVEAERHRIREGSEGGRSRD